MADREGGDGSGHLDPEIVAQIREVGGEELLRELFGIFIEHAPERLAKLRDALTAGDRDGVARAAHSVRSSASSIGARSLAELAGRVETLARAEEAPPLEAECEVFERAYDELLGDLRARA